MNPFKKQSIEHSVTENFKLYPENYAINSWGIDKTSPSDDTCASIATWIEGNYEVDEDSNKGSKNDWVEICINAYLSYEDFDEDGGEVTCYDFLKEGVTFVLANNYPNANKFIKLGYSDFDEYKEAAEQVFMTSKQSIEA